MDLSSKGLLIHDMSASAPPSFNSRQPSPSPEPSFPIIAVALIGILATAFLLVSYYVFAIKCGPDRHLMDLFGRFWIFRSSRGEGPLLVYSPPRVHTRGLEDGAIRSIPVHNFKSGGVGAGENGRKGEFGERSFRECMVCLNEFQEDEKLKVIPSCCHVFHVDCIDIWLQNNANCPLCRTSISTDVLFPLHVAALSPRPSPEDPVGSPELLSGVATGSDEDFVVIELDRGNGEGPYSPESPFHSISIRPNNSPLRSEQQTELPGKGRRMTTRFRKTTSMGDESIDVRGGADKEFPTQPMRRSISMDSATAGGAPLLVVLEALRQKRREVQEVIDEQGCGSSISSGNTSNDNIKIRRSRSFFSFGHHGRVPRSSAVRPHLFQTLKRGV